MSPKYRFSSFFCYDSDRLYKFEPIQNLSCSATHLRKTCFEVCGSRKKMVRPLWGWYSPEYGSLQLWVIDPKWRHSLAHPHLAIQNPSESKTQSASTQTCRPLGTHRFGMLHPEKANQEMMEMEDLSRPFVQIQHWKNVKKYCKWHLGHRPRLARALPDCLKRHLFLSSNGSSINQGPSTPTQERHPLQLHPASLAGLCHHFSWQGQSSTSHHWFVENQRKEIGKHAKNQLFHALSTGLLPTPQIQRGEMGKEKT